MNSRECEVLFGPFNTEMVLDSWDFTCLICGFQVIYIILQIGNIKGIRIWKNKSKTLTWTFLLLLEYYYVKIILSYFICEHKNCITSSVNVSSGVYC